MHPISKGLEDKGARKWRSMGAVLHRSWGRNGGRGAGRVQTYAPGGVKGTTEHWDLFYRRKRGGRGMVRQLAAREHRTGLNGLHSLVRGGQ